MPRPCVTRTAHQPEQGSGWTATRPIVIRDFVDGVVKRMGMDPASMETGQELYVRAKTAPAIRIRTPGRHPKPLCTLVLHRLSLRAHHLEWNQQVRHAHDSAQNHFHHTNSSGKHQPASISDTIHPAQALLLSSVVVVLLLSYQVVTSFSLH